MKYLILYTALFCTIMISCDAQGGGESNEQEEKKNVSSRDLSITKANAYSTLFMDSTAMEAYLAERKLPDSIARRVRSFYNTRNYQYAWFNPQGLTEQARGFWSLHDYHTTYSHDSVLHDKALQKKMDNLITEDDFAVSASDKSTLKTELQLTQHFIQYMMNAYPEGYVKRKEMERFVPFKKRNAMELADSLLKKKHRTISISKT
jgi:hypothetical protein